MNATTLQGMDLAGLEDDPDFWNMDLDVSDEVLGNTGIQNLNGWGESSFHTAPGLTGLFCSLGKEEEIGTKRDNVVEDTKKEPRVRSDGRYDCNHTCKDKTKCQHQWSV